jgi:ABC-type glycerol-3-phosphate transport system substrate-binding protein
MRSKRLALCASAFLAVALALSACGGSFSANSNKPMTLTYWYTASQAEQPAVQSVVQDLINQFEQLHPNIKVTAQYIPHDQAHDAFVSAAQSGSAPDLFSGDALWAQELASKNLLFDVTSVQGDTSDFDRNMLAYAQFNNGLFALPQTTDFLVLYYNQTLLNAKNLTAPKTMQDFDAVNKALTGNGAYGWEFQGDAYTAQVFIYAFGGGLINTTKIPPVSLISDPHTVIGLQFLKKELQYAPPVDFTNGSATTLNAFESGKVAMMIGHSDDYHTILTGTAFSDPATLGIAAIPQDVKEGSVPRAPTAGQAVMMSAKTPHQGAAFTLMQFISSETSQVEMAQQAGLLPTRNSAVGDSALTSKPALKAFSVALTASEQPLPATVLGDAFFGPTSGFDANLQKFLLGQEDGKTAVDNINNGFNALLKTLPS